MKVLGIDPGTRNLGWGFIEMGTGNRVQWVEHDCIRAPQKLNFYERIFFIGKKLEEILQKTQPDVAIIESIFLGKSVDSAFKLGHIRGVCAAHCQRHGAQIFEYSPRTVKKQITGSGSAEKTTVQMFLYQQLGLGRSGKTLDASDALALALCHILQFQSQKTQQRMREQ